MKERVKRAVELMADEAEKLGAECNDEKGIIRAIIEDQGFGFHAWFCVCCELANREARREGYRDTIDRAYQIAQHNVEARR